jgi:hypothetical protein
MAKTRPKTTMKPTKVPQAGAVATPMEVMKKPREVMPSTLASSEEVSSRAPSMVIG